MSAMNGAGHDTIVAPVVTGPVVTPGGRDDLRTSDTSGGFVSLGVLHRGWKTRLLFAVMVALLVGILAGVVSGNHFSAKAATQSANTKVVAQIAKQGDEIAKQGAEIIALTNTIENRQSLGQSNQALIQHELDILNDATVPGGKIYEAGQASQSHAIGVIVACLRGVVMNPTAPLPADCPAP